MFERIRVTRHQANGHSETTLLTPSAATQRLAAERLGATDALSPSPDADLELLRASDQPFWQEQRFERWRQLWDRRFVRATVGVVAVIVVGGGWFLLSGNSSSPAPSQANATAVAPDRSQPATTTTRASTTTGPESAKAGQVTVHVAGLVTRPGVISLPSGARVIDALEAVGGASRDGDLTAINLAAPLRDGMQVVVARVGSAMSPAGARDAVININTATADQLETLPGIGPTLAAAIVREREQRGPFRSIDDLQRVSGLGARRIADLKERVQI